MTADVEELAPMQPTTMILDVVVFTPGAIRRSLEERGLRVLRIQTHGLNPVEIQTRLRKPGPGRRPPPKWIQKRPRSSRA